MKPVRFIHTADLHLDTSFSGSGFPSRLGDRKREAIRSTFRRIIEDALSSQVDFLLIAGDLFELDRITPDTSEFLKRQFETLGSIPVFIAPGNHDPCCQGSPYLEETWPANVHIYDSEAFRSILIPDIGVCVTGFGYARTQCDDNPFQRLPVLSRDHCNIVVAHGSDMTRIPAGKAKHGPFTIEDIAGKNVQYCALGHYHQQRRLANHFDEAQVWYSGIPEGRGWDEEGNCGYLIGTVENGEVRVESRICSQIKLQTLAVNCDPFSTREQILDAILEQRNKLFDSRTILRVQLLGAMDPRLDFSPAELEERLTGEVLHIRWDDQTFPALDFASIAQEKTLRGRFVRVLNERIAAAAEADRVALERARLYGVQALSGREVRLR
jgi:DNA repair exonuclease SbcCD nuclease subunit